MKVFELLPKPLGKIFRKLTHLTCNSPLYHLMGQQKREEDHGVLKKRRKTNTSPMGEVGGAEKTMLIMPENCV